MKDFKDGSDLILFVFKNLSVPGKAQGGSRGQGRSGLRSWLEGHADTMLLLMLFQLPDFAPRPCPNLLHPPSLNPTSWTCQQKWEFPPG